MVSYLTIIKRETDRMEMDNSFGMVSYLTIIKLSPILPYGVFSFGMVSYLTIIKPFAEDVRGE